MSLSGVAAVLTLSGGEVLGVLLLVVVGVVVVVVVALVLLSFSSGAGEVG